MKNTKILTILNLFSTLKMDQIGGVLNEYSGVNDIHAAFLCIIFWNRFYSQYAIKNVLDYGNYLSHYCFFDY